MSNTPESRVIQLTEQAIAEAVLALQRLAYGREAQMIGSDRIPPLNETLLDVMESGEAARGVCIEKQLVGCITYAQVGNIVQICKTMVHPKYFRIGIGAKLLADTLSHESPITRVRVSTAARNVPAVQFYLSQGFKEISRHCTPEGIELSRFQKDLKQASGKDRHSRS